MPPAPLSPARSTSERSVLLIEEYDALAAAIGSALQKFAAGTRVDLARSFSEAETIAKASTPALIVIDFDPAPPGLTSFFHRMRDLHPDARVLVIGAGVSRTMAAEYRSLGGIQFIEKPFEITDFGAAVQALLGPWQDAESRTRGCLRTLGLADAALAQCAGCRTVVLEVETANAQGEIQMIDGHLVHAVAGQYQDAEALREMFGWNEPRVREIERRASGPRMPRVKWPSLFLEAVRYANARSAPPIAPLPPAPTPAPPRAKTGKKLVLIDDTEMLLIFVEDTLVIADKELQVATASSGVAGLKLVEDMRPDLVLLDYSLPDINGDEVCRRLLQNEKTASIPVLMMSGHIPEMMAVAETSDNVVGTIAKPFLSEALVALVQQTLKTGVRPSPKPQRPKAAPKSSPPKQPTPPIAANPIPVAAPREIRPPQPATPSLRPAAPPPIAPLLPPPMPRVDPRPLPPRPSRIEPAPVRLQPAITLPERTDAPVSAAVVSKTSNEVVLGLFLEVVSMQLTPSLRMGAIRAKPSSFTVSLHVSPAALRSALPVETGFELGRVELDAKGAIASMRLIPTLKPVQRLETRNALQIGGLSVVPHDSRGHMQLTPAANAPMMMHLLAHFEIARVELSTNFTVAQIVLNSRSSTVQMTLSSEAVGQEQTGALCETAAVRLDTSARIAELLLNPLK